MGPELPCAPDLPMPTYPLAPPPSPHRMLQGTAAVLQEALGAGPQHAPYSSRRVVGVGVGQWR